MSVEIFAANEHRPSGLPCRESGQDCSRPIVMGNDRSRRAGNIEDKR